MALYMEYSTKIYQIYLRYIAPEDIHVYSVDEVFIDVAPYLETYKLTPEELASRMVQSVYEETGITATAGIGTNLYLTKVALDIEAKHTAPDAHGVRIARLDENPTEGSSGSTVRLRISGGWEEDTPKSSNRSDFTRWETWRAVRLETE